MVYCKQYQALIYSYMNQLWGVWEPIRGTRRYPGALRISWFFGFKKIAFVAFVNSNIFVKNFQHIFGQSVQIKVSYYLHISHFFFWNFFLRPKNQIWEKNWGPYIFSWLLNSNRSIAFLHHLARRSKASLIISHKHWVVKFWVLSFVTFWVFLHLIIWWK